MCTRYEQLTEEQLLFKMHIRLEWFEIVYKHVFMNIIVMEFYMIRWAKPNFAYFSLLCSEELLEICSRLEPGISKCRGVTLLELADTRAR